ncbi:MAG TPA: NAD(P)H-dependent oxidoreductase [Luteibacter sp.]|nr:NAD(P)H-dependent oxidoreductase [Luteibacter sp.]
MSPNHPITIVAIAGSLRVDSWNRRLLEAAARLAPPGLHIDVRQELGLIPLLNEDLTDEPPALGDLRRAIARADGVLFATPEYNHSIPGVLKNLIDWLSITSPQPSLANKPVAILGASSGRWGTRLAQAALRQVLLANEALILPSPMLFVGEVERRFDTAGQLTDPATGTALHALLAAFGAWIDVHRAPLAVSPAQPAVAALPPGNSPAPVLLPE